MSVYKGLNKMVSGDNFVEKDEEDYIYASLSQPPIKIVNKNNSNSVFDYTVECPNCGKHVNYGEETFMISGHIYCSDEECRKNAIEKWGK